MAQKIEIEKYALYKRMKRKAEMKNTYNKHYNWALGELRRRHQTEFEKIKNGKRIL